MAEDRAFPAGADAYPVEPAAFDPVSPEADRLRAALRGAPATMPMPGTTSGSPSASISGVRG